MKLSSCYSCLHLKIYILRISGNCIFGGFAYAEVVLLTIHNVHTHLTFVLALNWFS